MSHARLVVADDALLVRAAACRSLVAAGELDGDLGLSYVVWPPEQLARASASAEVRPGGERPRFSVAERTRAVELVAAGLSQSEVAARTGCSQKAVSGWVRASRSVSETGN